MWACWLHILLIQAHPFVVLNVWLSFLFCQMDGQECLRTPSSYLCFSRLKLYSCYITKFEQVRFELLCVRSTRSSRFVIDLNFQNLFGYLSLTDSSFSVLPRSLSWPRFSISVQPIRTVRSHRVAVTACSFASRCHRVVPLGQTDRVRLYIPRGQILEIFPKPFTLRVSCSAASDLRIILSSPATSRHWSPSPSTEFNPTVVAVASSSPN